MPILGSPYYRGNSDVILSMQREDRESFIEGSLVAINESGKITNLTSGKVPFGIASVGFSGCLSIVKKGLSVLVLINNHDIPTPGGLAYVDYRTGLATVTVNSDSGTSTPIGIFTSGLIAGQDSKGINYNNCAFLDIDILSNLSHTEAPTHDLSAKSMVNKKISKGGNNK